MGSLGLVFFMESKTDSCAKLGTSKYSFPSLSIISNIPMILVAVIFLVSNFTGDPNVNSVVLIVAEGDRDWETNILKFLI